MAVVSDPIGDLLTRMRNAEHVGHASCRAPHSRIKKELLEVLKKEGWITDVQVVGDAPKLEVEVTLNKEKGKLAIKRISKPGRRIYSGKTDLKPVLSGFGVAILTTSEGLMTDKEARKKGIGGEVLCTIS